MLLAIDIGNTNITLGLYDGNSLGATWRISTDADKQADEYTVLFNGLLQTRGMRDSTITQVVICSVVPPLTGVFEEFCLNRFGLKPLVVGMGVKTGMRILYDNPRDVGADRVADAVAAYHRYGGPVIVVDCGTALVFDAVSQDGEYLGGAIAPGLGVAAEALVSKASKLTRVELTAPEGAIGRTPSASMQSGLIYGYVGLIEGLVARFKRELGPGVKVVATGGMAGVLAGETDVLDEVDPDLTLEGLKLIHEMNPR